MGFFHLKHLRIFARSFELFFLPVISAYFGSSLFIFPQVSNLQKTLKASAASPSSGPAPAGAASNQDADQPAEPRDPASSQEPRQPGKKSSKVKGWVLLLHLLYLLQKYGSRQPNIAWMNEIVWASEKGQTWVWIGVSIQDELFWLCVRKMNAVSM